MGWTCSFDTKSSYNYVHLTSSRFPMIPKPATAHDSEPILFISNLHTLFPKYVPQHYPPVSLGLRNNYFQKFPHENWLFIFFLSI